MSSVPLDARPVAVDCPRAWVESTGDKSPHRRDRWKAHLENRAGRPRRRSCSRWSRSRGCRSQRRAVERAATTHRKQRSRSGRRQGPPRPVRVSRDDHGKVCGHRTSLVHHTPSGTGVTLVLPPAARTARPARSEPRVLPAHTTRTPPRHRPGRRSPVTVRCPRR